MVLKDKVSNINLIWIKEFEDDSKLPRHPLSNKLIFLLTWTGQG
jgi:hypothetical protein